MHLAPNHKRGLCVRSDAMLSPLQGSGIRGAYDSSGSVARQGQHRWPAAKLPSLAAQLHKQGSQGDVCGVTPT